MSKNVVKVRFLHRALVPWFKTPSDKSFVIIGESQNGLQGWTGKKWISTSEQGCLLGFSTTREARNAVKQLVEVSKHIREGQQ